MSPPAHRRLFPLAAWLLALACVLAAPPRAAAAMTPPAKIASWGFAAPPSGRPGDPPPANQDCIRVGGPCAYEPASGRPEWLSKDPIEEDGGINLYGYVGNGPIGAIDPTGELGMIATALFSGLFNAGTQVLGNVLTDRPWYDINMSEVGTACVAGLIPGLSVGKKISEGARQAQRTRKMAEQLARRTTSKGRVNMANRIQAAGQKSNQAYQQAAAIGVAVFAAKRLINKAIDGLEDEFHLPDPIPVTTTEITEFWAWKSCSRPRMRVSSPSLQ